MEIKTIVENKEDFMDLLLLADAQEERSKKHKKNSKKTQI